MKKIVLRFGLISGAIAAVLMSILFPFGKKLHLGHSYWLGYALIVASMLIVFFGIKAYRDQNGGTVSFGRALSVGLLIALIGSVCYVATWEIIYFNFMPTFMDDYAASIIQKAQASGMGATALQAKIADLEKMKVMYANPWMNIAMTLMEPLPVGVLFALISAGILRKKTSATA